MKQTILSLLLSLLLYACNKDVVPAKPFCNVTDPAEDLLWLKAIISEQQNNKYNKMLIYKYEYMQQEGFLVDSCLGCPDSLSVFYNCSGQNICEFGGKDSSNTCPDFFTKSIKKEIVFMDTIIAEKPSTYFCQVDNPLEDLVWLKTIVINRSREFSNKTKISQCVYNGIQTFIINWCFNCPDGTSELFACDSTLLCKFGGIDGKSTCPDFDQNVTDIKVIWQNF